MDGVLRGTVLRGARLIRSFTRPEILALPLLCFPSIVSRVLAAGLRPYGDFA